MFRIIFLLYIVTIWGCGNDRSALEKRRIDLGVLNRVEGMAAEHPDSALVLLHTVDESSLMKRQERARYSLLFSELLDKNYIDLETDSVIRPAVEYFSQNGKYEDRAKMYYYLGRIHENAGRTEEAVAAFVSAEKYVGKEQYNLQGLIYSRMGYLYDTQANAEATVRMFAKARDAFRKGGKLRNLSYTLREEGSALILLENKEAANRLFYEALDIACQLKDTLNVLSLVQQIGTNFVFYYKDIKKAKDLLSDIYNRYCGGEIPEGHFALWGYICLQEKDLQKAEYYLMHDTGPDSSPYATIGTYEMWSMLYEQKKEYRKALDYVKRAGELRDSIYVVEKDKLVQNLERQYRTELLRAENEELHTINVYLFIIFLLIFFFFVCVLTLFVYRAKRKEREKEEKINSLKCVLDDWINFLKTLADMAIKMKKKPEQFLETFKENLNLKTGKERFFSNLHAWVNQSHNGIVDYLKREYPHLTDEDLDFCCLLYLKMPVDVMLQMYDLTNKNSLYNKRSDLRRKMGLSPEINLEQYLDGLLVNLAR